MKISVLIPVYNVADYLEECVASVLRQSWNDYEIVLIDDGSTDGSSDLCDRLENSHSGVIRVTHKNNEGVLIARRYGVRIASGDIIVFLDSDDMLRNDALELIHDTFVQYNCDMVIYDYSLESDYSKVCTHLPIMNGCQIEGDDKRMVYELMCNTSMLNTLWNKAVKKDLADMLPDYAGLSHIINGEDLLSSLPLVTNANRIVYLDSALYYYRSRPGSAVHSFRMERFQSIKSVHLEFDRYIDLWELPDLHPGHYAREVRGWIETMELMLMHSKALGKVQILTELKNRASDTYFRNAYEKMDGLRLKRKHLILANLLYEGRYYIIMSLYGFVRVAKSMWKVIKDFFRL